MIRLSDPKKFQAAMVEGLYSNYKRNMALRKLGYIPESSDEVKWEELEDYYKDSCEENDQNNQNNN